MVLLVVVVVVVICDGGSDYGPASDDNRYSVLGRDLKLLSCLCSLMTVPEE